MIKDASLLLSSIGVGRANAFPRPANRVEDRRLRRLINQANKTGDIIIPCENGYYRPDPTSEDEMALAEIYLAKELHRARDILYKRLKMKTSLALLKEATR